MKISKKKVLFAAVAVSLVAILSYGTLAWFTATDTVDNVFKVTTDQQGNPDFKLDLFEHDDNNDEVDGKEYNDVAPGDNLDKDPTVRNDGSYDQWVRLKVKLDDYDEWQAAMGNGYDFSALLTGVSNDWTLDASTVGTDTLVYYKNEVLAAGETSTLFTGVSIPGAELTVDNMPTEFHLNIVGEAIQSDNTGASAQNAFANYWS